MLICSGKELLDPYALLKQVNLRRGQYIADMGCGSLGHFLFPAASLVGPVGKVYAVDIQKNVLEHIQKRINEEQLFQIQTLWSDFEQVAATKIPDASLDVLLFVNNVSSVTHPQTFVEQCQRLIKPHGKILIADWKPGALPMGPDSARRVLEDVVQEWFSSPFFDLKQSFVAGPCHYGLCIERTTVV